MLILASASPRRRELLTQIAIPHTISPASVDESHRAGESPQAYVRRLASDKALEVARLYPKDIVLAADTTVDLDGSVLNKPKDLQEAETMLRRLSGRRHQVHTGVAVILGGASLQHVESTTVSFTSIPEDELAAYLATGDSLDKAGAYGIQGYAARWVDLIEGDFFNVMGLPLASTVKLLHQAGASGSSV